MKTMNWMKGMAFASVMMMSAMAMAQRNGAAGMRQGGGDFVVTEHGVTRGHNNNVAPATTYQAPRDVERYDDRRYDDRNVRRDVRPEARPMPHSGDRYARVEVYGGRGHVVDPYAGRVRHMSDGRWGYLRGNRWYYYDTYFEPEYYYSHPLRHFHRHRLGPVGKALVATAVIGSLIGILAH